MDVFKLREQLVRDYARYARSFIQIQDDRINQYVEQCLEQGVFWPDALIQLNPNFQPGAWIDELVRQGVVHQECAAIFRKGKADGDDRPMRLYQHQLDAILTARQGHNYVLTTGTGSGKSLAYIVPIVDYVLKHGSRQGVKAIVVYPMNALANSQYLELEKFLRHGYPAGQEPVTFEKYTGQESDEIRNQIIAHPPDIILTNYVMLELMLTRPQEKRLMEAAEGLRFLVLDELHTYRGRQGADVALLVRRVRDRLAAEGLQCVGTSATLAGEGTFDEQRAEVARVATQLFGAPVQPQHVIGETLQRATPEYAFEGPAFRNTLADSIGVMDAGRIAQWDSPYRLYHQPDTRQVADFVGLGAFLPGRVEHRDGRSFVQIELGTLPIQTRADQAMAGATANAHGEVTVLLRPDDVIHDDASPLQAEVVNKAFRGAAFLYTLRLPSGAMLLALVPSHHNHAIGERIGIRFGADHVVTFPADEGGRTPSLTGPA